MTLADDLKLVKEQLEKAKGEIVTRIAGLEDALAASGDQSVEVAAAVADLKSVAQGLDDVVADVQVENLPAEEEVAPAEEVTSTEETPAE